MCIGRKKNGTHTRPVFSHDKGWLASSICYWYSRGHHPSSELTPRCSRERRPFSETGSRIPDLKKVIPHVQIQRGLSTLPGFPSEFTLELGFPKTDENPW